MQNHVCCERFSRCVLLVLATTEETDNKGGKRENNNKKKKCRTPLCVPAMVVTFFFSYIGVRTHGKYSDNGKADRLQEIAQRSIKPRVT